jgi:probable F420-dependent oxidoreductase
MQFWINVPVFGTETNSIILRDIAEAADEMGFDAIVVPDHLLMGADADPELYGTVLESIVTISYLAARTRTIRVGTSVLVAGVRNAVVLAKQIATLDVLTEGRSFVGLAAGWSEVEFANVGGDFATRGAYADETIRLMRHLFSGSHEAFEGRFHSLSDFNFAPLPFQREFLPILVGGTSNAALRRAAMLGDMWQSSMVDVGEFPDLVAKVKAQARERTVTVGAEVRRGTPSGVRLVGETGDDLRAEVAAWAAAGCQHLSVGFRPVREFVAEMQFFATEVLPMYRN